MVTASWSRHWLRHHWAPGNNSISHTHSTHNQWNNANSFTRLTVRERESSPLTFELNSLLLGSKVILKSQRVHDGEQGCKAKHDVVTNPLCTHLLYLCYVRYSLIQDDTPSSRTEGEENLITLQLSVYCGKDALYGPTSTVDFITATLCRDSTINSIYNQTWLYTSLAGKGAWKQFSDHFGELHDVQ